MSGISKQNIDSMASIIAAMNGATGDPVSGDVQPLKKGRSETFSSILENYNSALTENTPKPRQQDDTGVVEPTLNSIMEGFRSATGAAAESVVGNKGLELAYLTTRDDHGVEVGSWRIDVREEARQGKFYNISHTRSGDTVINDLRLYEAALALVNGLNAGQALNSPRSKLVLEYENDYARALTDAVSFRTTMRLTESTGDAARHDVAEARYSEARRRAMTAKKSIEKLTEI